MPRGGNRPGAGRKQKLSDLQCLEIQVRYRELCLKEVEAGLNAVRAEQFEGTEHTQLLNEMKEVPANALVRSTGELARSAVTRLAAELLEQSDPEVPPDYWWEQYPDQLIEAAIALNQRRSVLEERGCLVRGRRIWGKSSQIKTQLVGEFSERFGIDVSTPMIDKALRRKV